MSRHPLIFLLFSGGMAPDLEKLASGWPRQRAD
jgi:hypothetical protein